MLGISELKEIIRKGEDEILRALERWEPDGFGDGVSCRSIGQLPEGVRLGIVDLFKPAIREVQQLGRDYWVSPMNEPMFQSRLSELRAKALHRILKTGVNRVIGTFAQLGSATPEEEWQSSLNFLRGGMDNNAGAVTGLAHELGMTLRNGRDKFHESLWRFFEEELSGAKKEMESTKESLLHMQGRIDRFKSIEQELMSKNRQLAEDLERGRLGFAGKVRTSFGAVGTFGKVLKGSGIAAGLCGMLDGGRRALNAVEVDKETGEVRRNWVKTVLGGGEAAVGAAVTIGSAALTGKHPGKS